MLFWGTFVPSAKRANWKNRSDFLVVPNHHGFGQTVRPSPFVGKPTVQQVRKYGGLKTQVESGGLDRKEGGGGRGQRKVYALGDHPWQSTNQVTGFPDKWATDPGVRGQNTAPTTT